MSLPKKIALFLAVFAVLGGAFIINAPKVKALTVEELQAQIDALLKQLATLQAQLAEMQGPFSWCHTFNTNLKIGMAGTEVKALQIALGKEGDLVYDKNTNDVFDEYCASAVVGFQEKYASEILTPWGLEHGTGYVGPTTRAKLNALYGYKEEKPTLAKNCGIIHEGTKDYSKAINFVIVPADSLYGNLLNDPNAQYSNNLNVFITDANKIINDFLSINPINGYKNIFNFYYNSTKIIKCTLPGDYVTCDLWKEAADDCNIPYDEVIILQRKPRGGLYGGPWIQSSLSSADFTHEIGHFFGLRDVDNLSLPVGPNHCDNLDCCGKTVCQAQNWCSFERIELGGPNCCFYLGTTQNTSFYIPNEQTVYYTCTEIEKGLKFNHFNHLEIKYLNELFATISSLGKESVRCGSSFMTTKYCPVHFVTCSDSDGGKNYYMKGGLKDQYTTQFPAGVISDSCAVKNNQGNYDFVSSCEGNNCFVAEYYCVSDTNHDTSIITCPYGCQDGACVPQTPSITVLSPNGGEQWVAGQTYEIKWSSTGLGPDKYLSIYLTLEYGTTRNLYTIVESVLNDGDYQWTIPSYSTLTQMQMGMKGLEYTENTDNEYKIRIEYWLDGLGARDDSDNYFSIVAAITPSITVLSPNGGEQWQRGTAQTIRWTSTNLPTDARILLTLWDKTTLVSSDIVSLVSALPATQTQYTWTIPSGTTLGTNYRVTVETCRFTSTAETCEPIVGDNSDASFSIVEKPTEVTCTDSDGGKDYYTKGYTEGWSKTGAQAKTYDSCLGDALQEWYCDGNYIADTWATHQCPYGCQDGACKLGVKLSPQTPASHEVAAVASPRPLDKVGWAEMSHLFLAFDIDNPSSKPVSIEQLAVAVEGNVKLADIGQVVWQVSEKMIGATYFNTALINYGTLADYGYAKIPNQTVYWTTGPLLTIPSNSVVTVKVFAFIKSTATEGATIRFVMPSQELYTSIKAVGYNFGGLPISGNTMTVTKKTLSAEMKYQGTYNITAKTGSPISAVVTITNNSTEDMLLTEVAMGNPATGNDFLTYTDKNSYSLQYNDSSGAIKTAQLRDTTRSTASGYRLFDIFPSITLASGATGVYTVSGNLNAAIPVKSVLITFAEFSGYGAVSYSPVKSNGALTGKIIISQQASGLKDIENSLASIYNAISSLIDALRQGQVEK